MFKIEDIYIILINYLYNIICIYYEYKYKYNLQNIIYIEMLLYINIYNL